MLRLHQAPQILQDLNYKTFDASHLNFWRPLNNLIPGRPIMTPSDDNLFGGLSFLKDWGAWSKSYSIKGGIEVSRVDRDLLAFHPEDNKRVNSLLFCFVLGFTDTAMQAINAAAQFGHAAGKIYVPLVNGALQELSGFWLEKNYFITCAHFFVGYEKEITELQKEDVIRNLRSGTATTWISTRGRSVHPGESIYLYA